MKAAPHIALLPMVRSAYRQADEVSLAAVAPEGRQEISLISIAIVAEESPVRVNRVGLWSSRACPLKTTNQIFSILLCASADPRCADWFYLCI